MRGVEDRLEWAYSEEWDDVMRAPRAASLHAASCVTADAFRCEACGAAAQLAGLQSGNPSFLLREPHAPGCTAKHRAGAIRAHVARWKCEP